MKCKQCNSEIPDDSMFCEHCGTKIVPNSRIGKWPAILIIAGIALAVGIGIIIGKMSNKNTNSNTDVAAVDTVAYESTHETFAEVDEDMIDRKNNSGFEKGSAKLLSAIDGLSTQIEKFGAAMEKAFSRLQGQ